MVRFSFELASVVRRALLARFQQAQLARSETSEMRSRVREMIADSRALMARIDDELAQRR